MTWKEFKDEVETQGLKDTDELSYIDLDCKHLSPSVDIRESISEGKTVRIAQITN